MSKCDFCDSDQEYLVYPAYTPNEQLGSDHPHSLVRHYETGKYRVCSGHIQEALSRDVRTSRQPPQWVIKFERRKNPNPLPVISLDAQRTELAAAHRAYPHLSTTDAVIEYRQALHRGYPTREEFPGMGRE